MRLVINVATRKDNDKNQISNYISIENDRELSLSRIYHMTTKRAKNIGKKLEFY